MWCTGKEPGEEAWATRLWGRDAGAGEPWVAVQVVHCQGRLGQVVSGACDADHGLGSGSGQPGTVP